MKSITVHPNYTHGIFYNDIALVELEKEVDYSKSAHFIKPACLHWKGADYVPSPGTLGVAGMF